MYYIQASNGMYYKKDSLSDEWMNHVELATKFKSIRNATIITNKLKKEYHIDCDANEN